jgi:hypothetical protein
MSEKKKKVEQKKEALCQLEKVATSFKVTISLMQSERVATSFQGNGCLGGGMLWCVDFTLHSCQVLVGDACHSVRTKQGSE